MTKPLYKNKLIICLLFFFIISLLSIFSAQTISNNNINKIFIKQIIFYLIGTIILLISYYKKKEIIKYSFLLYIFFNILLIILLIIGININGSKCWIIIGPISFQPSEFMKIFLVIINAKVLTKYNKKSIKKEFKMLLIISTLLLIPSILTFLEPDTGVVIIYFIITISMILYRGIDKKWYIIALIIVILMIISIIILYKNNMLNNTIFYRLDRLFNWQNQTGYQLENSLITIGSSGLLGYGINNIPIYYPESSTDFIFTSFSTIFGFIGNIILFIIFITFDFNILNLCNKKIKKIDEYIIIGYFTMIFYQQIQNICMTIGLLPITGITLPFISYGGSSLLSYMIMAGIVLNISNENIRYRN